MRVLVVGANGQLGARTCQELLHRGHEVRGSVRAADRAPDVAAAGVELVEADVATGSGVEAALDGVEGVLLSANAVLPRAGDSPRAFHDGALRLVDAAEAAGVRRFVLPSVPVAAIDDEVPPIRTRREREDRLATSPMETVVVRLPPFCDVWLGLVGSSLPTRGEAHASLDRPSPFLRRFRRLTGTAVERRGVMLVPGPATSRHAFITVQDAASALVTALERHPSPVPVVEVGGPEVLSWREVAGIFSEVLGRDVRVLTTPGIVYAAMSTLLRPVAEVPSSTMALNRFMAASQSPWKPGGGLVADPGAMTTVRSFLAAKAGLPASEPAPPTGKG